jgi:DNA-binding response OmpR family regulator
MKKPRILLVEDEKHIAQGIIFNLELEGFLITHAETGAAAMDAFGRQSFDLVVLDLMLPDSHGFDLCREMRKTQPQLPILMLTALGEEQDRINGLKEGADDYLTKPFSLDEFLLRIRGMLRRSAWYLTSQSKMEDYQFGGNLIDLNNLAAETTKGKIRITELEGRMLATFFSNEGETLTRATLLKSVWGMAEDTETRTLDNFIVRIRKYFEEDPANPKHFLTVRGRGYQFIRTPEEQER